MSEPVDTRTRRIVRLGIMFSAPALVVYAIFFLWPLLRLLSESFSPKQAIESAGPSIAEYVIAFTDPYILTLLLNSVVLGLFTTLGVLLIGYPVAFYLTRCGARERAIISAICLLPIFTSIVVSILGWYVFLLPFGILHTLLLEAGLVSGPVNFLRTFTTLIVVLVYEHLAFGILILVASIQGIPGDKLAAARTLGAGVLRTFFSIILPLTVPGLIATSVLVFALSSSSYLVPILIAGNSAPVLPIAIFSYTVEILNWPKASALAMILLVVVWTICLLFSKAMKRLAKSDSWEMV